MLTTQRTTLDAATGGLTGTHDAAVRLCEAQEWLEAQRHAAPVGADVWDIRWQAQQSPTYLADLLYTLRSGQYRLSPLQLHGQGDERKAVWGAQDALVLKWVALSIEGQLPLHPACEHVKGHGGGRPSVSRLHGLLTGNPDTASKKTAGYAWVCRTDIRGYYRNINKVTLLNQVSQHVQDPVLVELIRQYIHYTVEDGGTFHTPEKGISRGCPLSPLMGALHLYDMDEHFSQQRHIHYARYMDDIIILAATRWQLRKQTKRLMQWFSEYGFEAHPDKTQIGRTRKGFDWMGAWLTHEGMTDIAPRAKTNHCERGRQFYELLARVPHWLRHRRQQQVHARVSAYRKRWNIWAAGLLTIVTYTAGTHSSSATALTFTGLPAMFAGDATTGATLGRGTVSGSSPSYSSSTPSAYGAMGIVIQAGDVCTSGSAAARPCLRVVGGIGYAVYFPNTCPSMGFRPESIDTNALERYPITVQVPAPDLAGIVSPASKLAANRVSLTTMNGTWVLLDDVESPSFRCDSYTPPTSGFSGIRVAKASGTVNGIVTITDTGGADLTKTGSTPNQPVGPAPEIGPVCEFTNAAPLSGNFGSQALSPTTINNAKHAKIIATGTPDYFPISISCTGNMTGVQPMIEIKWSKSVGFGGGSTLKMGTRTESPSDDTNGVVLLSAKGTVGNSGPCSPQPTGKDLCSFYNINPGTPLNLYPTLFRNTNTTDKVQSGPHTVTGTIDLVMP